MPAPKKKKDAVATDDAPAVHDLELHTAARADGLDQGIVAGKRVSYAVRGCAVCAALVEEGFSKFHPEAGAETGVGLPEPSAHGEGRAEPSASAANPAPPVVTIVETDTTQAAIAALFQAAEEFKPGLAEKLGPAVEMAMREWAKGQEQERTFAAWQASVTEDLRLMKEAVAVLHNNMSYLYKLETENVLVDLLLIKRALNIKPGK